MGGQVLSKGKVPFMAKEAGRQRKLQLEQMLDKNAESLKALDRHAVDMPARHRSQHT